MDCVGALLMTNGFVGTVTNSTAQVTQTGANVTVVATDVASGAMTHYTGSAGAGTIALNMQSCTLCTIQAIQCADGTVRDITLVASILNATVTGNSLSGMEAQQYQVTYPNGGAPSGARVIINKAVSGSKQ
jgi:hypothetical protein